MQRTPNDFGVADLILVRRHVNPDSAATYERARRLANQALWTVDLQRRRLNSEGPEDAKFILRQWSDFYFLIMALTRLRRAAELAAKVPAISERMRAALRTFDAALPHLTKMRNVAEHIDDYAVDSGKDRSISRKSLEVGSSDGENWEWLGFETDAGRALSASTALFQAMKGCASLVKVSPNQGRQRTAGRSAARMKEELRLKKQEQRPLSPPVTDLGVTHRGQHSAHLFCPDDCR